MDGQTRPTMFVILGVLLLLIFPGIAQAEGGLYTVKNGDTVYTISKNYGVAIKSIEITNNISHHLIHVGQQLIIPEKQNKQKKQKVYKKNKMNNDIKMSVYKVKPGDNLYHIAKVYDTSVSALLKVNKLNTNFLRVGQILRIPRKTTEKKEKSTHYSRGANKNDLILLAKIINAESGGEDYIGQVAVGAVILNRLDNHYFPKSIKGIIYERTRSGGYQFTPVANGAIHKDPTNTAINAAKAALAGKDPTKGALFFYNPQKSNDKWIRTRKPVAKIGNHVFAK